MQSMFNRNIVLALFLAASVASCASDGSGFWDSGASGMGYTSGYGDRDREAAPPADPNRKISQQDCAKPFVPDGGNLRCL